MAREVQAKLRSNARTLRTNMTDTERFVWYQLRARRFQGYKFRRQFAVGRYIVDFICLEEKIIVELDGGQHVEQQTYDDERTLYLESCGFRVLRFWNHIVLQDWDVVGEVIWRALQDKRVNSDTFQSLPPSPLAPLPPGERGARQGKRGTSDVRKSLHPLTPNPSPSRGEGNQTRETGNQTGGMS